APRRAGLRHRSTRRRQCPSRDSDAAPRGRHLRGHRDRHGRAHPGVVELPPHDRGPGAPRAPGIDMIGRRLLPVLLLAACRAAPLPPEARWPAGTGFDAKTLVVDGTPIRYIEAGAGPAVVLIHGFAASMYAWRHTIGPLAAAGYRVVAFDDRGFGFSARPATGYANADYVRLVVALLDSLHIPDAVLVGHSMGGEIAAEVALAHPERVRALALVDAAGLEVHWAFLLRAARWRMIGSIASGVRSRGVTARVLRSMYADPAKVTESDVDQYYAPVAEPDYGRPRKGVLRQYRFGALSGPTGG